MRLEEIRRLGEHERMQHTDQDVIPMHQLEDHLSSSKQMPYTISSDRLSAALFLFQHDADHHLVLIVPRQDQHKVVGYIQLAHVDGRWQVISVWLQEEQRGQGLITNLYRALTSHGYHLQSGDGLSGDAEKVWRALGSAGVAKVLDSSTGQVEEFSDKPVGDGDIMNGVRPRFYWVTEGQCLLTTYHRGGASMLREHLGDYLAGRSTGENFHLIGMGSHGIVGEV